MLNAGRLRHRIDIQRPRNSRDEESGAANVAWLDKYTSVPCEFTYLSARELIAAQTTKSKVTARVLIRFRADVDPSMRILFRGKVYNIEGVLPDADSGREYLTLPVSEGTNDG